jgi:hypothetical protein
MRWCSRRTGVTMLADLFSQAVLMGIRGNTKRLIVRRVTSRLLKFLFASPTEAFQPEKSRVSE